MEWIGMEWLTGDNKGRKKDTLVKMRMCFIMVNAE